MLFTEDLCGGRGERQLMREVQVNVAYRWFAGFGLTDRVPDTSNFLAEPTPSFHRYRRLQWTSTAPTRAKKPFKRDDRPRGFFYLDRRTVDAKHSLITDTHVTRTSVYDSEPYLI